MQKIEYYGPDFIIIGAMKAATSAIYEYLMQHPLVRRRFPKELHFFTLNYSKGLDWYLSQFEAPQNHNKNLLIGEASPSYFPSANVPTLIYKFFPNVKIIVSLRNPTDRAISHYYHQVNRVKDETRPIELAFSPQEIAKCYPGSATNSYLQLGNYISQLKKWFDVFPKEQILVLNYHELETNPDKFIKRIFTFLKLQDYSIVNLDKIYNNQYPEIPLSVRTNLDQYFEPYNKDLENFISISFK